MINIQSIKKSFGDRLLLEDVSFTINRRERIGLVGRNGDGKTTLLRIITGQETQDAGEIVTPRRYRIGYLEQHIQFTQSNIVDEVCLGLPRDMRDERWRGEKILAGLGFGDEDMEREPEHFSGGFQVRLNLARVLVSEPDLLLLDEPTNYLDIVSIRWLGRFLRSWPSELILITHDRSFMDQVVTHTVAIHRRRAKKIAGDTGKLYAQILQEEEIYEKTRANEEKKRRRTERFIERFRAKNTLATRVQSRIKLLEKQRHLDKLDTIQTLDFSFNYASFPAKVMLRTEDMLFAYNGGPELIGGLSIDIHSHDRICVIGQNGRGKSTLLRLLAGELTARRGKRELHGKTELGYFAQTNVATLDPHRTVVAEIQAASKDCLPQTARNVAGAMMFEGDAALKKVSVLSGGEKSRVMLGRLLVTPSNLILLDEPTNHLDMDSCDSLLAAVDNFAGAVVMVTHNEMFLRTLATRFIVFDRGMVRIFDGSYQDFLDKIGWEMDESTARLRPSMGTAPEPATVGEPDTVETKAEKPRRAADRKSVRRERARLLQERSRIVAPLEKRVHTLEKEIEALESEAEGKLQDMETASMDGEADALIQLSRDHVELTRRVDACYEALARATADVDEKRSGLDREIARLDGIDDAP